MDDLVAWIVLVRACGITPIQQLILLNLFKYPEHIKDADASHLRALGLKNKTIHSIKHPDTELLATDIAWLDKPDHCLVTWHDKRYPQNLREIADPPVALFVAGDPDTLNLTQLGIVGSRNPSATGRRIAIQFANQLSRIGFAITSGLALGIDYCAHKGTLDADGYTIAVLGSGPDKIYPARHRKIAENISRQGALISEFPPGTPPLAKYFPRRNRIISGLSSGILVVEADKRSGSLITARFAMEQGREVFAVPGSIYNPLTKGCHYLIKQGAKLVESIEDIVEELHLNLDVIHTGIKNHDRQIYTGANIDIHYRQLLDNLSFDPVSIDRLIEVTGLTSDTVSSMLLFLEVQGVVSSAGGLYTRIS